MLKSLPPHPNHPLRDPKPSPHHPHPERVSGSKREVNNLDFKKVRGVG